MTYARKNLVSHFCKLFRRGFKNTVNFNATLMQSNFDNLGYNKLVYAVIIIIIISLLMSPLLGHRPSLWITHKENGP
jgi:hypothetical protein